MTKTPRSGWCRASRTHRIRGDTDTVSRNFRTPVWPVEMQKLLRSRRADPGRNRDATGTRVAQLAGAPDRTNRTFVCAVLFLDIVDYSKKPVSEQLKIKERFTARIAEAIEDISVDHRIILDTGDGVAINFLDDPEDALFVRSAPGARISRSAPRRDAPVEDGAHRHQPRAGALVKDINGQPNIIGDGINVAERVMSFARHRPGRWCRARTTTWYRDLRAITRSSSTTKARAPTSTCASTRSTRSPVPPTRRSISPPAAARPVPSDVPVSPLCWTGLTQPAHRSLRAGSRTVAWPTGQRRSP